MLTRDRGFYRRLAALALPVTLQNLMIFAAGFADSLMTGALGDEAMSGVFAAAQVQLLLQYFSGGIEGTLLILAARCRGENDGDGVNQNTSAALLISLSFALVLAVFCFIFPEWTAVRFSGEEEVVRIGARCLRILCPGFVCFCANQCLIAALRSAELARVGMISAALGLAAKLSLNVLLIFGAWGFPRLGAAGAAVATLAARVLELCATLSYLLFWDHRLKLKLRLPGGGCLLSFLRCGAPITGGQLVWSVNMLASSAILGGFGARVLAAASATNSLSNLAYAAMNGAATAAGVIIGEKVGAGDLPGTKEYARTLQMIFLLMGVLTASMVLLLRAPFISVYRGMTPEAAAHARRFALVLAAAMLGTCYQQAGFTGIVKAGGDVDFVFHMDLAFVFLLVLPLSLLARRLDAPPWLVYACLKCDQLLKCPVAAMKINRFDWIREIH